MESVGPRRRGHETLAFPAKSLEITLAKTPEIRARLLEMAMPALQRKRLERLDLHRIRTCRLGTRQEPQDAIMQKSNSCQMEQTRKVEDPAVPIEEAAPV